MRIIVQKFGGTSLSTPEARARVVHHVTHALGDGYRAVVVVSAMGRRGEPYATDTLLDWVRENGGSLPPRETDMLLYCGEMIAAVTLCSLLEAEGVPSTVLNGAQAGIVTDETFGNARIQSVQPARILELLEEEKVVIVTGFQGRTAKYDFTTLGRGGSDTSATALGVALEAEIVDIYTDVSGILTADPKIVEDARPLDRVTFNEICNMAHNGAKVIHPRAVEIAMQANVPIRVRSTFSDHPGTLVTNAAGILDQGNTVADRFVTGIAHVSRITQVHVPQQEGVHDLHRQVFNAMAQQRISVDFINVNPSGVVYTVSDEVAERAGRLLRELGYEPSLLKDCAKVAVIGGGINGVPGIMASIVDALAEESIPILQSADSNTTIWVLVRGSDLIGAVNALHRRFQLNE